MHQYHYFLAPECFSTVQPLSASESLLARALEEYRWGNASISTSLLVVLVVGKQQTVLMLHKLLYE
jgi:hypothetical protein